MSVSGCRQLFSRILPLQFNPIQVNKYLSGGWITKYVIYVDKIRNCIFWQIGNWLNLRQVMFLSSEDVTCHAMCHFYSKSDMSNVDKEGIFVRAKKCIHPLRKYFNMYVAASFTVNK